MSGSDVNVSRETSEMLDAFQQLVLKWNNKINLISRASAQDGWERHITDSLQLYEMAPEFEHWVDLGSGGGFPGIPIAIRARETGAKITLVESDKRKATFLRQASRELGLKIEVISERIEQVPGLQADILSARALAHLEVLILYSGQHMKPDGLALFPKGKSWKEEVDKARQQWNFDLQTARSKTERAAAILCISGVSRA